MAKMAVDGPHECINRLKRVLEEVPDPQSLFAGLTKIDDSKEENEPTNVKLTCSKYENEYTKLKHEFIQAERQAKMLHFLLNKPHEEWPSSSDKENFAQVKNNLRKATQSAEDVEEKLIELIGNSQEKADELKQRKREAEERLASVEEKRARLETLRTAHSEALDGLEGFPLDSDVAGKLQKQREALRSAELALQRCDLAISEHKGAVFRLKEGCCMMVAVSRECQEKVQELREERTKREEETKEQSIWLDKTLHAIKEIAGINDLKVEDKTVTLDLVANGLTSEVKAELKMTFRCPSDTDEECKLVAAELGQDVLDCRDVVQEAVTSNDPTLLVTEVKRRLNSHAPILQEVEKLRNEFAIDYLHEERKLQVMLGSSGQVVCSLTIDTGYPARGGVTLTKIEGNGHHKPLNEYKPPMPNPRMSDWLQYLQSQL